MLMLLTYERIVRIRRRLRDKDVLCTFDEVMRSHICHDLRSWQDLDMELLLDCPELLSRRQYCFVIVVVLIRLTSWS